MLGLFLVLDYHRRDCSPSELELSLTLLFFADLPRAALSSIPFVVSVLIDPAPPFRPFRLPSL
jgi:hypothetical protein